MSTFWDRAAGLCGPAERTSRKVNAAAAERVAELVPAGARVLDCAAGTGRFSPAAERAGRVTAEAIPGHVPEGTGVLEKPAL